MAYKAHERASKESSRHGTERSQLCSRYGASELYIELKAVIEDCRSLLALSLASPEYQRNRICFPPPTDPRNKQCSHIPLPPQTIIGKSSMTRPGTCADGTGETRETAVLAQPMQRCRRIMTWSSRAGTGWTMTSGGNDDVGDRGSKMQLQQPCAPFGSLHPFSAPIELLKSPSVGLVTFSYPEAQQLDPPVSGQTLIARCF